MRYRHFAEALAIRFLTLYRDLGFKGASSHSGRRTSITKAAKRRADGVGEHDGELNMTVSWRRSTPKAMKPFWTIQEECRNPRPDPPNEFCQSVVARLARPIAQARRRFRLGHGREVSAGIGAFLSKR